MPIINYDFHDAIFSAKEVGNITAEEAQEWSNKLTDCAQQSPVKLVALVDALEVKNVVLRAVDIFTKASYTPNVIAIVVATNNVVSSTATNIGLLGMRNKTLVFRTLQEARECCANLLAEANNTAG